MTKVLNALVVAVMLAVLVVPASASAQATPAIELVELRNDHSLLVEWTASGASSYDVGVRASGGPWVVGATATSVPASGTVGRVLAPTDWAAVPGVIYEVAVRESGGSWSTGATVEIGDTSPQVVATTSGLAVTATWAASAAATEGYEVFAAAEGDSLYDCLIATASSNTTSLTISGPSPQCGGGAWTSTDVVAVAVRAVRSWTPRSVHEGSVAMAFFAAAPVERLSISSVNGAPQFVDQNQQPRIFNGINMRRGELNSFAFNPTEVAAIGQLFDSIRIAMEWERFEPEPGVFDVTSFAALDRVVGWAGDAGLEIILDPVHMAEAPTWDLPDWAWERSNDGAYSQTESLAVVAENVRPYLQYVTHRYSDDPWVVAIDVLNEPREPAGTSLSSRNAILMQRYHDLVVAIRAVDPDKPLILEPYYGSALIDAATLSSVGSATTADPAPDASDFTRLAWSLHDYYSGRQGTSTSTGYSGSGYPAAGLAADGTRVRADNWTGTSCYPAGASAANCLNTISRASVTRPSMTAHVRAHLDAATAAGMPLYVGEFGVPHAGQGFSGWAGGAELLSDKVAIYDDLGVSRAVWIWRQDIDVTYGLYDRATAAWHPWADYAAGALTAADQATLGDADCNGTVSLLDARLVARFAIGVVTGSSTCPPPGGGLQAWLPVSDVDGNADVGLIDARYIAQCAIGVPNLLCPGA